MCHAERFVGRFVCKYPVEIMHHAHRLGREALEVFAQPDQNLPRAFVDGVHKGDLLATLRNVPLVDAYLVRPEPPRRRGVAQADEGIVDTLREGKARGGAAGVRVEQQRGRARADAPDIRYRLILWLRREILVGEAADEGVVVGSGLEREDADGVVVDEGRVLKGVLDSRLWRRDVTGHGGS